MCVLVNWRINSIDVAFWVKIIIKNYERKEKLILGRCPPTVDFSTSFIHNIAVQPSSSSVVSLNSTKKFQIFFKESWNSKLHILLQFLHFYPVFCGLKFWRKLKEIQQLMMELSNFCEENSQFWKGVLKLLV